MKKDMADELTKHFFAAERPAIALQKVILQEFEKGVSPMSLALAFEMIDRLISGDIEKWSEIRALAKNTLSEMERDGILPGVGET